MGFVVKIMGDSPMWPQWIGQNTTIGRKALVMRDEARVFPTEIEAKWEVDSFRLLLPAGVEFAIEDE